MIDKISKKNPINFNDFWPHIVIEAQKKGLGKVEWMERSGIAYQRYSEFENLSRDISARYFIKLIGGLNLTLKNAEKALRKNLTEAQKKQLRFESQVDANRELLERLFDDHDTFKLVKNLIKAKKA